jgi:uncharacterized protein (DUF927 family)
MDKQDLRVSTNLKELSNIVKNIIYNKSGFTIWQNIDDEKVIIPGVIESQFISATSLTLGFKISDSRKINTKSKLFMLNLESGVLIKGKVKIIGHTKIKVLVDKKFYLKEKRENFRILLEEKNINAHIQRKMELKDILKSEQVKVKDISDSGCGFFISPNRAVLFQPDSSIILNSLEGVDFEFPIKGTVRHVTPVATDNSALNHQYLLVGVEFEKSYQDIDTIVQKVEVELAEI